MSQIQTTEERRSPTTTEWAQELLIVPGLAVSVYGAITANPTLANLFFLFYVLTELRDGGELRLNRFPRHWRLARRFIFMLSVAMLAIAMSPSRRGESDALLMWAWWIFTGVVVLAWAVFLYKVLVKKELLQ